MASVVEDLITHLENQGIGKSGVKLRSRPIKEAMEGVNWETIFVKSDPGYIYPSTAVNIDYNRLRVSATGTNGPRGYERANEIITKVYKVCRLYRNVTLNGTFYPSIIASQPPYESNFFTDIGVAEMTIQVDMTRYTAGQIQYQCEEEHG